MNVTKKGKDTASLQRQIVELQHRLDIANAKLAALMAAGYGGSAANADEALLSLTLKQHAALQLMLIGASNAEIATVFDCKETTAKVHVRGVMLKFGVKNRAHLFLKAKPVFDAVDEEQYEATSGLPKDWATRWHERRMSSILTKIRSKKRPGR